MTVFRSSIGPQLAAFERQVESFVTTSLKNGGARIRRRMSLEQLNKPKEAPRKMFGLRRKTGRLDRSQQHIVVNAGGVITLTQSIGKTAYYAEKYEDWGQIAFIALAEAEFKGILDGIQTGLQFFNQGFGRSAVSTSTVSGPAPGFAARAIGGRILLKRAIRKENRARSWRSIVRNS